MPDRFDVDELLSAPPKLHLNNEGQLISDWRVDDQTVKELDRRLSAGMRTVETGAGVSTIVFAAKGCRHTCIVPDHPLVDRILTYCQSRAMDHTRIDFIIAKSRDVVHQLTPGAYDFALIDGAHGFPTAYVDFCYLTVALRKHGILLVDDMHIHTCRSIAEFMESDASWRVEMLTSRFALGVKMDDTGGIDGEWVYQPFVFDRSAGGKDVRGVGSAPPDWYPRRVFRAMLNRRAPRIPSDSSFNRAEREKDDLRAQPLTSETEPADPQSALPKVSYDPDLVPPLDLMRREQNEVLEEWYRWADEWSILLRIYGRICKRSCVLEIGCGLGRLAFPLRSVLWEGRYEGFDICDYKIEFLQTFQKRYPNFRFIFADIKDTSYNPGGSKEASEFVFPYPDASFDAVFAASVFTHMLPAGCRRYFRETARVLRHEGRAVFSFFLLENYAAGRPRPFVFAQHYFEFQHHLNLEFGEQFAVGNPDNPEEMVAYDSRLLTVFAEEAGLKVDQVLPGVWSGSEGPWISAQDLIVFRRV
jgi:SAM-dependent methyltransferase